MNETKIFERNIDEIETKIMNMSLEEFVSYDPTTDCIDPQTGEKLVSKTDTTMERFKKFRNNQIDFDADQSLESCIVAMKAYPFIAGDKNTKISVRNGGYNRCGLKYEITGKEIAFPTMGGSDPKLIEELTYAGDTMNSVMTTINAYYKKFKCRDFELPQEALDLIDVYHTMGNFMMIPVWQPSINMARGSGKSRDYFDLYLLAIYNYYREMCGELIVGNWTLKNVLGKSDVFHFSDSFLEIFMDWNSFVEENHFQDFVEKDENGYGMPKELWTGHFNCEKYVKPVTKEQFTEFFVNAAERIKRRSARIYKAMKKGNP